MVRRAKEKPATCFVALLRNELNSDVALFTTHKKHLATLFVARLVETWVVKCEA